MQIYHGIAFTVPVIPIRVEQIRLIFKCAIDCTFNFCLSIFDLTNYLVLILISLINTMADFFYKAVNL